MAAAGTAGPHFTQKWVFSLLLSGGAARVSWAEPWLQPQGRQAAEPPAGAGTLRKERARPGGLGLCRHVGRSRTIPTHARGRGCWLAPPGKRGVCGGAGGFCCVLLF